MKMDQECGGHAGTQKLRPLSCELGHLSRPDGSATLTQGDSCAIASVYGPGEVRINKELMDRATVEVTYKPKSGQPACSDKSVEKTLRQTCEAVLLTSLHPRSSVNITIQEMQNSGSFLAVCINSACLALLDASVSMKSLMAAIHCCIDEQGEITLDPTDKQEQDCVAGLTFVFDNVSKNVITVSAIGQYSTEQFQTCLALCQEATAAVFQHFRETLNRKLQRTS